MYNRYKPSSRKSKSKTPDRLFCAVKVGTNECQICNENAYYSSDIRKRYHKTLNKMELFRCGHGMCGCCMLKDREVSGCFKCPFCRDEGGVILKTFGSNEIKGEMNTIDDYIYEWRRSLNRAWTSCHPFVLLHNQIVSDYKKKRAIDKKRAAKKKYNKEKKETRELSCEKAICAKCGKDTFTSEKQLAKHMVRKHKNDS